MSPNNSPNLVTNVSSNWVLAEFVTKFVTKLHCAHTSAQYQRYGDTWPHSVYVFHWPDLYNACIVYNVCIHTDASVHKKLSTQGINRCWSSGHLISRKHSEEPIKVYQPFPDCFLDPYNISSPSHFVSPPLKGSLPPEGSLPLPQSLSPFSKK